MFSGTLLNEKCGKWEVGSFFGEGKAVWAGRKKCDQKRMQRILITAPVFSSNPAESGSQKKSLPISAATRRRKSIKNEWVCQR